MARMAMLLHTNNIEVRRVFPNSISLYSTLVISSFTQSFAYCRVFGALYGRDSLLDAMRLR